MRRKRSVSVKNPVSSGERQKGSAEERLIFMAKKTLVIGHRNPDMDSAASCVAVAELKRALGEKNVYPALPGLPGARAKYIFEKFKVPLPQMISDVYPRVRDIVSNDIPHVNAGTTLLNAISELEKMRIPRLPVLGRDRKFKGMLCLYSLLGDMLQLNGESSGFTGRLVHSSIDLITEVLDGNMLNACSSSQMQDFEVYVAAMNVESFKQHIPQELPEKLAIIVGDRSDIHLLAINMGVRLMLITGKNPIDPLVLQAAKSRGISIITTKYDSATVVRRLKFSSPVELATQNQVRCFRLDDRLNDIKNQVFEEFDDVFPVLNRQKQLAGTFRKSDLSGELGLELVLVDHNEFDQSIPGVDEAKVVEVIDHHRMGMPPTRYPIKITCDVVGSTSTLVTEMFITHNIKIPVPTAGILMGGIITDTLLLRSPTSCGRDRLALEHLKKITGIEPDELMNEIFQVGSLIAKSTPLEVVLADRKVFQHLEKYHFAISQVEEVGFEEFEKHEQNLLAVLKEHQENQNLHLAGLLVTDVVNGDSILLATGNASILDQLPFRRMSDNLFDLPGVMSRKKQVLPQVLATFDNLKR